MSISFVSLDFETANNNRASACEVGLYRIIDGEPAGQYSSLILPPESSRRFDPRNVSIHGIREEDVLDAPQWADIWPEVKDFIGDLPLVAHNASFDLSVFRATLREFGFAWPEIDYWCTLVLSRSALNLPTYTLGAVSQALGVQHEGNHRAMSDAQSAANVLIRLLQQSGCSNLEDATKVLKVTNGRLFEDSWLTCRSLTSSSKAEGVQRYAERLNLLGVDGQAPDPSGDFYGKAVAITGTLSSMKREEAQQLLTQAGAIVKDGVSSKLDYLISGLQDLQRLVKGEVQSTKYRKVEEYRSKGSAIEIIDEEQFLQMLRD